MNIDGLFRLFSSLFYFLILRILLSSIVHGGTSTFFKIWKVMQATTYDLKSGAGYGSCFSFAMDQDSVSKYGK